MSSPYEFTYGSTFAGCGGSSLGYKWAGGHGVFAVEFDDNAVETYRLNFPGTPVLHRDIATVTAEELLELTGMAVGQLDILDGSPPCQGFSTAGKRQIHDPRNSLFMEFVRLIDGLQPKVFVMENVSGMVKGKMKWVFRQIMLALKATGYHVRCKLLNAMYFNVPQSRERLIWIGVRDDIGQEPTFPDAQSRPMAVREVCPNIVKQASNNSGVRTWRSSGRPANTLTRSGAGKYSGMCIDKSGNERPFTTNEIKRIASFPDEFEFAGGDADKWARIGNSVPPRFMQAIAEHIRDNVLTPVNTL